MQRPHGRRHPPLPQRLLAHFNDANDFFGGPAEVVHAGGDEEGCKVEEEKKRNGPLTQSYLSIINGLLHTFITTNALKGD